MSNFYSATDHFTIIPALMLALFGCAILLFDFLLFPDPRQRKFLLIFVVIAEIFTGVGLYRQQAYIVSGTLEPGFNGAVTIEGSAIFFNWVFPGGGPVAGVGS